jgi:hypothetical protein
MTQKQRIHKFLVSGKTLTRLNAWDELGVLEAPARICELRAQGCPIKTTMVTVRNRYGENVSIAHWTYEEVQLSLPL